MLRYPWLNDASGLACSLKNNLRKRARTRCNVRLLLEQLEDRVVPSGGNLSQSLVSNLPIPVPTATALAVPLADPPDQVNVDASLGINRAVYSLKAQPVDLSASVTDATNPKMNVNKGSVAFSVTYTLQNKTLVIASGTSGPPGQGLPGIGVAPNIAIAAVNLPAGATAGTYDVKVKYTDPTNTFVDNGVDKPGDLLIRADFVGVTTASPQAIAFSQKAENVTLNASVANSTFPKDNSQLVNEGTVTFTISGKGGAAVKVGGIAAGIKVVNGTASTTISVPAGTPAGDYTITATFADSEGNYSQVTPSKTGTLTINPAKAKVMANPVQEMFSPNAQTVALSAIVTDQDDPSLAIDEGAVNFKIDGVGTVQAPVIDGKANADITIPAGEAVGSYKIEGSYSDGSNDFVDSGDTDSTLTIANCDCATLASTSANQLTQNLFSYISNLESQLFTSAQMFLTSLSAMLSGQQPLTSLVQPLLQLYEAFFAVQAASQPHDAQAQAGEAGTEAGASYAPQLIGD